MSSDNFNFNFNFKLNPAVDEMIEEIITEIANKYHQISKIINNKTHRPYQNVDEYINSCYGNQSGPIILDNRLVENMRLEWDTILEPIKQANLIFLENMFAKNNRHGYIGGYLDGFKIAIWAYKRVKRIVNAPIINDTGYGTYLGNGLFTDYFVNQDFAYPNELERSIHLEGTVKDLKDGKLLDYLETDDIYRDNI